MAHRIPMIERNTRPWHGITEGDNQMERNPVFAECPVCNGESVCLGELGVMVWYRCRNCGHEFYIDDYDYELDYSGIDELDI